MVLDEGALPWCVLSIADLCMKFVKYLIDDFGLVACDNTFDQVIQTCDVYTKNEGKRMRVQLISMSHNGVL